MVNVYLKDYTEVQKYLNATYDSVNKIYTLFNELTISEDSFKSQVDFADLYVSSYALHDENKEPEAYRIAKLCALNLACFRILVVASGGLLEGITTFRLGDLHESRAESIKIAVENSINLYKTTYETLILQIGTIAKKISASDE